MATSLNKKPAWFRLKKQCPFSGLPVFCPDIFISSHKDSSYSVEMAKLGESVLLIKASGYVHSFEMTEALEFTDRYLSKAFPITTDIIVIEDYADVEGADSGARKQYFDYFKSRKRFAGGILFNLSRLFIISFNLAKRLHFYDKNVYAVNTYEQAINLFLKKLNQKFLHHHLSQEDGSPLSPEPLASLRDTGIAVQISETLKNFFFYLPRKLNELITDRYSSELLAYIEAIDWKKEGITIPDSKLYQKNSFKKVFDAISYIKSEIDTLFAERIRTEQVLQASETKYRELVEHAKAGILVYDYQQNKITSVNETFLDISGYSKEELLSMDPFDLINDEGKKNLGLRISQLRSGETIPQNSTYQIISKNGDTKWVLVNSNITVKNGKPEKAEVVITDITDLKLTESRLLTYQTKLRQLSVQLSMTEEKQKRKFASLLHESISQELFAAYLKVNMFGKTITTPEKINELTQIKDCLLKIIKDTKTITYDLSPPVLYDLGLKEAIETLSGSIESTYGIRIKKNFNGNGNRINDDIKIILYRSISELLHNAVKHANPETVFINVHQTENILCIEVIDDGTGFNVEELQPNADVPHHGFGLFDIKEKMSHLGGSLYIDSMPGKGTTMRMEVPLFS